MRQVGCGRFLYLDTWCPEAALLQLKPAGEHGLARLTVAVLLAVLKKGSPGGGIGVRGRVWWI